MASVDKEKNNPAGGELRVLGLIQDLLDNVVKMGGVSGNDVVVDDIMLKIENIQKYEDATERETALRAFKTKMAKEEYDNKIKHAHMQATGVSTGGARMMGKVEMEKKMQQYILDESSEDVQQATSNKVVLACAIIVIVYFGFGIGMFCQIEGWSFVDSFYFCVVTITTVGYGDLMPSHDSSKWFSCFFVIFGVGLVGGALGILGGYLLDQQDAAEKALMKAVGADDDDDSNDFIQSPAVKSMINAFGVLVFTIFVGVFVYMGFDDLTFVDAFYMSCITVTTVGYGDFSPTKEGGRIVAIFWILFSVVAVARAMGSIVDIFLEWRQSYRRKKMLQKQVGMGQLAKFSGEDGKLDFEEFCLLKMQVVGLITGDHLKECAQQFTYLDKDHSGTIDAADLEVGDHDTQNYLHEARAGHEADSAPEAASVGAMEVSTTLPKT